MNFVIDITQLKMNFVSFAEKKKNIIVDGTFTKIVYSNNSVNMNGIYLCFPIYISNSLGENNCAKFFPDNGKNKSKLLCSRSQFRNGNEHKYSVDVDMNIIHNSSLLNAVSALETDILSYYKLVNGLNKHITYTLRNQIMTGTICVSSADGNNSKSPNSGDEPSPELRRNENEYQYILKISGIWETTNAIGLTYKFLTMRKFSPTTCFHSVNQENIVIKNTF